MAANLADHQSIKAINTISGNTPRTASTNEKATQTFFEGAPVQLASGVVKEWDGTTVLAGVYGISRQYGSNLATDGAGAPPVFGSVGAPGTGTTFGKVPYEASAVNIPRGAPFSDGRTLVELAVPDTLFEVQVDNGSFAVAADATPVQADVGKEFGCTKDATGHWYLDRAKTTAGTNTIFVVKSLHPVDGSTLNARVYAYVKSAASQVNH